MEAFSTPPVHGPAVLVAALCLHLTSSHSLSVGLEWTVSSPTTPEARFRVCVCPNEYVEIFPSFYATIVPFFGTLYSERDFAWNLFEK
ncbi:unnamed protein product [Phytomonas sp. EM1]|nr:unnamed protein product [Phytomonas sp. EM1]|eukprot:CCW61478.1 unnamed protein product [Phytomonas sp. isolate EM1]